MEEQSTPQFYFEEEPPQPPKEPTLEMDPEVIKVRPKTGRDDNEDNLIFAFEEMDEISDDSPDQTQLTVCEKSPDPHLSTTSPSCIFDETTTGILHIPRPRLSHKNTLKIQRVLFFPQKFYLYDPGDSLLVCSRRKLMGLNSIYYFFNSADMESTKNSNYIGYMSADSTSTEYKLQAPDDTPLAVFRYNIKKNTPGTIRVYISDGFRKKPILQRTHNKGDGLLFMKGRQPEMNIGTGKFYTRLQGLAKTPSCKNCAVVLEDCNTLVMGKEREKQYNLHYSEEWSDLVALAFAISNYEDKEVED